MTGTSLRSRWGSGGPMRLSLPLKSSSDGSGGSGGALWVSNCLLVCSILTLVVVVVVVYLINHFVFQPQGHIRPSFKLGGYRRV